MKNKSLPWCLLLSSLILTTSVFAGVTGYPSGSPEEAEQIKIWQEEMKNDKN